MINLKALLGNNHIKEIINQHFFHAYIIEGAQGSGKHTLTGFLAQSIVCTFDEKPCGHCKQCEKYLSGNHPDIMRIDGSSKIAEMRDFLSTINLAPNDGDRKVYIINNADNLSPLSQNTLLRPLEEPTANAIFILLCTTKEGLLETVRSRCISLTMAPIGENEIFEFLKEKYPKQEEIKIKDAAFLSGGYIGRAIKNLEQDENLLLENCKNFYNAIEKNSFSQMSDVVIFKQRNELEEFVSSMKTYLQKKLHLYVRDAASSENEDKIKKLLSLCSVFEDIEAKLDFNVNINLWSTYIIMKCRDEMKK